MKRICVCLLIIFPLAGCVTVNPYSRFYVDNTQGMRATHLATVKSPPPEPFVYRGTNPQLDAKAMLENGYGLLGYSSFNAGPIDQNQAVAYAKNIHADAVVVYSTYTHTLSGSMPLNFPDVTTVTTHGSGQAFGSGSAFGSGGTVNYSGSATAFGQSQSTIYGSRTTYVPYNVNRYDYHASFWMKLPYIIFGAFPRDLTAEERRKISSNSGIALQIVIRGSPAYAADLFEGDIITAINGRKIPDVLGWQKETMDMAGQTVTLDVVRDDSQLSKQVSLNKLPETAPNGMESTDATPDASQTPMME